MTNKAAYNFLSKGIDVSKMTISGTARYVAKYFDAEATAIEALEKQIPKKPIDKDSVLPIYDSDGAQCDALFVYRAECPVCGNVLCDGDLEKSDMVEFKFCSNCGQAIDWSEEE